MRKIWLNILWLTLLTLNLTSPARAQASLQGGEAYGVEMQLTDARGRILTFLIGDSLLRDAKTGQIRMTGGVQIRGESQDLLLIAENMVAQLSADAQQSNIPALDSLSQLQILELQGQVFGRIGAIQMRAENMHMDIDNQIIRAPAGPTQVMVDGQSVNVNGPLLIDGLRGVLQASGRVQMAQAGVQISANRLQIQQAPDQASNQENRPPAILMQGDIRAQGDDFVLTAGRMETSADGQVVHFSGGITFDGPQGSLRAGSISFDAQGQDFTIDRESDQPIRGLVFMDL